MSEKQSDSAGATMNASGHHAEAVRLLSKAEEMLELSDSTCDRLTAIARIHKDIFIFLSEPR